MLNALPNQFDVRHDLMKTWFMKPLRKNSNFKIGFFNEDNIVANLSQFVCDNTSKYSVHSINERVSIVGNNQHIYLHTSADWLSWLDIKPLDGIGPISRRFAPIEMKTVTQSTTDDVSMNNIRHVMDGQRVIEDNFGSPEMKLLTWTPG